MTVGAGGRQSGLTPRQLAYRRLLTDFATFSRACYPGRGLRGYQLDAAAPILAAVEARVGGAVSDERTGG